MFNLDQAIAEWRRKLAAAGLKSRDVLDELESHLREDIEQQMRSGTTAEQAFQNAVQRVGAPGELNQEFGKISITQPRLSRRATRSYCLAAALFIFAIDTWTLLIYDLTPAARFLGIAIGTIIAGYIGALPDLNRAVRHGLRGWILRNTVGIICNGVLIAWMCLLFLSLARINVLPDAIVLNVACWGLFAAAAFTIIVLAYGTETNPLDLWSPDALQSLELATAESIRFHHDFIGTEHVLLGLMEQDNSAVPKILNKLGVRTETVRAEIEKIVGAGLQSHTISAPPYTPRVKKAFQIAIHEAKAARRNRVETEHLFLGLLGQGGGIAAIVLNKLGVNATVAREEIRKTSTAKDENV